MENESSSGSGSALAEWRQNFKIFFVKQTILMTKQGWREIIESYLKTSTTVSQDIRKAAQKLALKSTAQQFLKQTAYKWLKHLLANPPTDATWFPHLAIEVAHTAFRLKGEKQTFKKYLASSPSKMQKLQVLFSGL